MTFSHLFIEVSGKEAAEAARAYRDVLEEAAGQELKPEDGFEFENDNPEFATVNLSSGLDEQRHIDPLTAVSERFPDVRFSVEGVADTQDYEDGELGEWQFYIQDGRTAIHRPEFNPPSGDLVFPALKAVGPRTIVLATNIIPDFRHEKVTLLARIQGPALKELLKTVLTTDPVLKRLDFKTHDNSYIQDMHMPFLGVCQEIPRNQVEATAAKLKKITEIPGYSVAWQTMEKPQIHGAEHVKGRKPEAERKYNDLFDEAFFHQVSRDLRTVHNRDFFGRSASERQRDVASHGR